MGRDIFTYAGTGNGWKSNGIFSGTEEKHVTIKNGGMKAKMEISIIDTDIPLLLGLDYQKKWGIITNTALLIPC